MSEQPRDASEAEGEFVPVEIVSDDDTPESQPPAPATPQHPPRSRLRKWSRRVLAAVVVGAVIYVGWVFIERAITRSEGRKELQAAIDVANQSDTNWEWDALCANRKRPPEGKNGAVIVAEAHQLIPPDFGKRLHDDKWKPHWEKVPPSVRLSKEFLALVQQEHATASKALEVARKLKDYPVGYRDVTLGPNAIDTDIREVQKTRLVADLLRWDIELALDQRDTRRASESLLALVHAANSMSDEPVVMSQFVRLGIRDVAIQETERRLSQASDEEKLAELQAALAREAEIPVFLYGMRGERAAFHKLIPELDTANLSPTMEHWLRVSETGFGSVWWRHRANLPSDHAFFLSQMNTFVDIARKPIEEQIGSLASLERQRYNSELRVTDALLPPASIFAMACWRLTAKMRCAVAGIACERFRLANDRWPDSLNELVPKYLSAVPVDVYTNEVLQYAKLEDGIVVYSMGMLPYRRTPEEIFGWQRLDDVAAELPPRFRVWNTNERRTSLDIFPNKANEPKP